MLGCGLVVGQLFLVQEIGGSNPPTPATQSAHCRPDPVRRLLWRDFSHLRDIPASPDAQLAPNDAANLQKSAAGISAIRGWGKAIRE
jgi:hypothetical protein